MWAGPSQKEGFGYVSWISKPPVTWDPMIDCRWLNQPIWKNMQPSNWIISPGFEVKNKKRLKPILMSAPGKMFELPPPKDSYGITSASPIPWASPSFPSSPTFRPGSHRWSKVGGVPCKNQWWTETAPINGRKYIYPSAPRPFWECILCILGRFLGLNTSWKGIWSTRDNSLGL